MNRLKTLLRKGVGLTGRGWSPRLARVYSHREGAPPRGRLQGSAGPQGEEREPQEASRAHDPGG